MFQSFDDPPPGAPAAQRLAALREHLAALSLTGLLVPHNDAFQNEYLPPSEERLAWATGFTGSAGSAIVLADRAAIFVDGRYTLQAATQVEAGLFDIVPLAETTPEDWLKSNLRPGDRLGYDPSLLALAGRRKLESICEKAGASLVATPENAIDAVWRDRPAPPLGPIVPHPERLAGATPADKLARIGEKLAEAGADALVLTEPDGIAWTFNIRGRDVQHTPLPLAYAILRRSGRPLIAIDGRKLSNAARAHLAETAEIVEPQAFDDALRDLSATRVLVDPQRVSSRIADLLTQAGATLVEGADPVTRLKAAKNPAEIAGARAAHARDATALTRFLAWLDAEAPGGKVDEIAAAEKLEGFRAETGALEDISFPTISGFGPNGAVVHYRVTRATSRPLQPGSLYLVDSGAQYRDGTTDVTRTIAVGAPSAAMRRDFTLVLKGHIAIATARFPPGTSGAQLDTLARIALWKAGLDFDHGTGHGVGSYLSVHEGPQRISKLGTVALESGMILSNEPGLYRAGEYGIRIENLILVTDPEPVPGGTRDMLGFETLTLAPIDRRLVDPALLTPDERNWLDTYHARVRAEVTPSLDAPTRAWLEAATEPL